MEKKRKRMRKKGKMWAQMISFLTNLAYYLFSHIIQTMEKIKFLFLSLLFLSLLFLSNQTLVLRSGLACLRLGLKGLKRLLLKHFVTRKLGFRVKELHLKLL